MRQVSTILLAPVRFIKIRRHEGGAGAEEPWSYMRRIDRQHSDEGAETMWKFVRGITRMRICCDRRSCVLARRPGHTVCERSTLQAKGETAKREPTGRTLLSDSGCFQVRLSVNGPHHLTFWTRRFPLADKMALQRKERG